MKRRAVGAVFVASSLLAGYHPSAKPVPVTHVAARVQTATTTTVAAPSTTVAPTTTTTLAPPPDFSGTTSADAVTTAKAVAAAEYATLDPATPLDVVHNAGWALELGYRRIGALDPSFEAAVSAALPDDLRQPLALNVAATRELLSLGHSHATAPPAAWHIAPVAGADELLGYYHQASAATGVPWEVLAAIHLVETKLGRVVGDSSAGAQGPMQFLPATWAAYGNGGDIHSNRDAIMGAARYLAANGAPVRLDDALHHYNPTPKYVNAVKDYAQRLSLNPNAYRGYHEWQVIFRTATGNLLLPEGWPAVPATPLAL
ncbi:MAG TPA: lytic transglycosylase domain-containing protein [Acidimicrobiales bacterium]|nr:lytic transglycosylase domain-containing protein [Acidimicrobiales bacterium]